MITELLKMIETVDPSDTVKLDEIDVLVWLFLSPETRKIENNKRYQFSQGDYLFGAGYYEETLPVKKYTRSRDALKRIRPDGYITDTHITHVEGCHDSVIDGGYFCQMYKQKVGWVTSPILKTEELAQLHAILQVIQWERDNEKSEV